MNEQATILFNISSFSFSGESAGKVELSSPSSYLQRSIYSALARSLYRREGFDSLGRQLAAVAHHAYFSRQLDVVEQASQLMLALPLSKELKSVARYYQALCITRKGDFKSARHLLERVVGEATSPFRAKALLSIGATYYECGDIESASPYYLNAARVAGERDLYTFVIAQKMMAVVRSIYGDHQQALADLERLFPIIRATANHHPVGYAEFLNSYAVELGEVGRIEEAQNVCAVTLASPFAAAYPEFAETRDELAARRTAATPSVIAVPAALETISSPQAQVEPEPEPARARPAISILLRRSYSLARPLTKGETPSAGRGARSRAILDRLAYSTLPRSPPALS